MCSEQAAGSTAAGNHSLRGGTDTTSCTQRFRTCEGTRYMYPPTPLLIPPTFDVSVHRTYQSIPTPRISASSEMLTYVLPRPRTRDIVHVHVPGVTDTLFASRSWPLLCPHFFSPLLSGSPPQPPTNIHFRAPSTGLFQLTHSPCSPLFSAGQLSFWKHPAVIHFLRAGRPHIVSHLYILLTDCCGSAHTVPALLLSCQ